jgi:protein TonB
VDLTLVEQQTESAGPPAPAAPRAGAARPPTRAGAVARTEPRPAPVPPPAPLAPPAAPRVEPAVPAEASPLVGVAPVPSPVAASAMETGTAPAPADVPAGGRAGETVRGDAGSGPGGPPGSALALATPAAAGTLPPEYGPYLRSFRQRVLESLAYPLAARRQGLAGTVELHVWLEPSGRVRDVQVARSSSHALLDEAAVETVRRLGPVPFPESLPRRPLLIRLPLVFELR